MSFEKVVEARVWGFTSQNSSLDASLTMGDSSGGTFTSRPNRLRGTMIWDRCMFVLQNVAVAGGATGGSYTVSINTDAVAGFTDLPIAQTTLGPNSPTTVVMDSLHQSASAPQASKINITQTASGGALTLTCDAVAKQYRGTLSTPGSRTSERVLQGQLIGFGETPTNGQTMTASSTWTCNGLSASNIGMNKMRLWDSAFFWITGVTVSGEWSAAIVSTVGGNTVSVASCAASSVTADGDKVALANSFYGQCPNPTAVIVTENSAGTLNGNVIGIAKSGRGSLAKQ